MSLKLFPSIIIVGLCFLLVVSSCAGSARADLPRNESLPSIDLETPASINTASFALG
jgi:hypothetical protein